MRNKVLPEKEFELGGLIDHATGGYGNITKKQRWERAKIKALHNLILSEVESYAKSEARVETAKQIFAVLDNLHIVENWDWSTQKGKGIPLLLKQIGAYKEVKKKFGVLK